MRTFRDLPIGTKLIIVTVGVSSLAFLFSGLLELTNVYFDSRKDLIRLTDSEAHIIGSQTSAAIEFGDVGAAKENLNALNRNPAINLVCLYRGDSHLFVFYSRRVDADAVHCPAAAAPQTVYHSDFLHLYRDIILADALVGRIYIRKDLTEHRLRLWRLVFVKVSSAIIAILLVFILIRGLQKSIIAPVNELASAAEQFALTHDYGLRVKLEEGRADELGVLSLAFNNMLSQIQNRDAALVSAKEAAERANTMKSEFLANMSHELRTPLNSQLILSELLCENVEGNLTHEQLDDLRLIHKSSQELLRLINDILDLTKIEAGKMHSIIEAISLPELAESLQQQFNIVALNKGLALSVTVDPHLPTKIHSDSIRLEQILRNFLSNAFKFTEQGTVDLAIQKAVEGDKSYVDFVVKDSGIGIPEDKRELIFESFTQVDGSTRRKYGGTGLGLSLVRELSALLGATVMLDSTEGEGSQFTLRLPLLH